MDIEKQAEELRKTVAAEKDGKPDEAPEDTDEKPDAKDDAQENAGEAEDQSEKNEEGKDEESGDDAKDEAAGKEDKTESKDEKKPGWNSEQARKRREDAKKAKEEKQKPEGEAAKDQTKTDADAEPDKAADPMAHLEWRVRQAEKRAEAAEQKVTQKDPDVEAIKQERLIEAASVEFDNFAEAFKKEAPDTEAAVGHVMRMVVAGIRALNPLMSDKEVIRRGKLHMLGLAKHAIDQGYPNPVAAIYDLAHEQYGYAKAEEKSETENTDTKQKKPPLEKLEEVKKKSTSSATAGGRSTKAKHLPDIDKLSPAEFEKLSAEEKRELLEAA